MRALRSTNAESLGHTEHSTPEDKRVHPEADRMEEAVARHGCSRPEELHRETVGQGVGRMETADQEVGHTVAAGRRMGREAGEAVVRKAKEPVQVRHKAKEPVQAVHHRARERPVRAVRRRARKRLREVHMARELHQVVHRRAKEPVQVAHRRAKEPVQVARMAMGMGHWRAVAGKVIDWVEEDQRAELAEKVPLLLRSRSRMHLSCQSGRQLACRPWACRPLASHPSAYRRR